MKNILKPLVVLLSITACQPPEAGYLGDNIRSVIDTIVVNPGVFERGPVPDIDGSTYPIQWEITGIRDADGNPTDALTETHKLTTWTSPFNPETDTSLELAEEKLEVTDQPSIILNPVSGEFAFTQSTKEITGDNTIYHIDVKATNLRGERELKDFAVIKMLPFRPVQFPAETHAGFDLFRNNRRHPFFRAKVFNDDDPNALKVLDGTHPYISIRKLSDEPSQGVKAKMIIQDSKGSTIDPSKILVIQTPRGPLQNYHQNSVETVSDDEGTTFSLPAPPFPQYGTFFRGDDLYLMYYTTSRDALIIDTAAYEADNGEVDWSPYTNANGDIPNIAYIRWGIKIVDSGTWELKMKLPYTIKR